MSRRTKFGLGVFFLAVIVVAVALSGAKNDKAGAEVRLERVEQRNLVAAVTASGKIQADAQVDISADITGRIVDMGVKEGDLVKKGQFLIQIDPAQYQSSVKRLEGNVASAEANQLQAKTNQDQLKRQLDRWLE